MSVDPDKAERLARAAEMVVGPDAGDLSARLARFHQAVGLAKMHWVQETLGFEPDARFETSTGFMVHRNASPWRAGFAYGGRLTWSGNFFPIKLKPSACGLLVAGLAEPPDPASLRERLVKAAASPPEVDGLTLEWDLGLGRHFVNCYRSASPDLTHEFEDLIVIHGPGREMGRKHPLGPDDPEGIDRIKTPWGRLHLVRGSNLEIFEERYRRMENFALRRREKLLEYLFGRARVLFNRTHHGLGSSGEMFLGCHPCRIAEEAGLPLLCGPGRPAFWVRPGPGTLVFPHGAGSGLRQVEEFEVKWRTDGPEYFLFPGRRKLNPSDPSLRFFRGPEVLKPLFGAGAVAEATELVPGPDSALLTGGRERTNLA